MRTDWSSISGFADRNIVSIDPVHSLQSSSPYDSIIEYTNRTTVCTDPDALCHEDCYVQSVKDQIPPVNNWGWAGTPRSTKFLPFLPKSILTGCTPARRSLARGVIALWSEIGIYQDYEEATRLVNALEHGAALPNASSRQALFQFLHHIYHTTQTIFAPREVEYIAAMSSAILEYDNIVQADVRTYEYLINMLTPVGKLPVGETIAQAYATEPLGNFTWDEYESDLSLYSADVQSIITQGANRTFGSTEFNSLSVASQNQLLNDKQNGTGAGGWVEFYPLNSVIKNNDEGGAPFGVFLLTPEQFNIAQGLN